ncbi:MAG: glycoside hydrolase family 88 protein [Bifidobacteriaceae bacterium]|jgi:unsaturated chondroitin disaccharide hydrolase|nr:glycoside hydrolase family 88 protein [Bifidobacteriaceae bacterium]
MTIPVAASARQAERLDPIDPGELARAAGQAVATVRRGVDLFGSRFPGDCSVDGRYQDREGGSQPGANIGWTTGFRTGMIWLANELRPDPTLHAAGLADVDSFADRLRRRVELDTHDIGFLYLPSCVAAWRLVGSREGLAVGLGAAEALMGRFVEPAGIFQAWGPLMDSVQAGRAIIDSAMNMPLLHWASRLSGDPAYAAAATRHMRQLRDRLVRADNSTFHTFVWDTRTGAPLFGATAQGYSDGSCWARGQAWAVYGFALNYRWTGDATFLDAARRCAEFYLSHLPADHVPYWDLVFQNEACGQPRDSSGAAIAVCGLLELAGLVPDPAGRERYRAAALATLDALIADYAPDPRTGPNAQLLHGVYDIPSGSGVDEASLWGDFFYVEALTRLILPAWTPYWLTGLEQPA